ncbi:MAG: O-antigen ligase family protein, partial [Patescibacteria group bacterium]
MSNTLLKLIKFGIGFILFIPLYVGGSFFFPFIFPKIWLFQLATEIIFFFYVVLAISDSRFRPKFNLVLGAVLLLTLILIITSFTGVDIFRSFWGNTERMSGVIAWFHFVAVAVILSSVLSPFGGSPEGGKNEREWRNFFGIAVVVGVLEFFYVLAQYFGALWTWLPGSQIGTIGNTDLLGMYAIFSAFFALYLWRNSSKPDFRNSPKSNFGYFWAMAFFLNIGTLYFASSRGAILGFGAGILVYALTQVWQKPQTRKVFAAIILILVVLGAIIWLARGAEFVKKTSQLTRIVNFSLKDDTVQQRFTEWGIAWNAFRARPVFGWGPNNYLYLHNAFLNPRVYDLRETNFDRAHNAYLDYASMSGILGLSGYLFLIAVLFWTFWKNKLWVLASLVIAYSVSSFFVFDSPASYIALFLTIGFAIYVRNGSTDNPHKSASIKPQTIAAISIFYFLVSIFLIWQVSIKSAVANYKFATAFSGLGSGALTPAQAFESYQKSLKYETLGASEFRNQYSQWLRSGISRFPVEERLAVVDFGINQLEKEVKDHPLVFSYLNLGQIYYFKSMGAADDSLKISLWQKSAQAYEKAIELSPKRLEVYYSYLQLALTAKDYNRAVDLTKKTTEFAPNYGQNWWYLGIANISAGHDDEASRAINHALTI